jgi:hypothetical protein
LNPENDGCRDSRTFSRAMVCKEGWGEDRERPYRVESWVVVLTECSQRAVEARVEGGGERARGLGGWGGLLSSLGGVVIGYVS